MGGGSDVILVYPEREGKERGRERKRKLFDEVFVYISPKLHKLSQTKSVTGGPAGINMLKREI